MNDLNNHKNTVRFYACKLGKHLELSSFEINMLDIAANYHDVGKAKLPKEIVNKPGPLTVDEYEIMKTHVVFSKNLFESAEKDYIHKDQCSKIILYHHENYDGTGYYKLKGEEIPLLSRIIRITDVFAALTEDRCYKKALDMHRALKVMWNEKHFYDYRIFCSFISILNDDEIFSYRTASFTQI